MNKLNNLSLINNGIKLTVKNKLKPSITKELVYKVDQEPQGFTYTFEAKTNNCFALRALIAKYDVFTADRDVLYKLREQTQLATLPILSYSSTGHVVIQCPPLDYYKTFVMAVGATNKGLNKYTVPIARAFDVIRASNASTCFLPKFKISQELIDKITAPMEGFNGTIASLFNIPISELCSAEKAYRVNLENFNNIGYNTVADFLIKQPKRYIDKTNISNISDLREKEPVTFVGRIIKKDLAYFKHAQFMVDVGGTVFECTYYQRSWMVDKYNVGDEVLVMGDYKGCKRIAGQSLESLVEAQALDIVPIYPQSAKNKITTKIVMNVVYEAIERIKPYADDLAPYVNRDYTKMSLGRAINEMHFPSSSGSYINALKTLALYELIYIQLLILDKKSNEERSKGLPKPCKSDGFFDAMLSSLPWDLTVTQTEGLDEINKFLETEKSEQMLLSADVGSGKGLLENEKIATPDGWQSLKNIKPGDLVIGRNGQPTEVVGVYPQGKQKIAKLTFDDGAEIITDFEHRWSIIKNNQEFVVATKDLLDKNSEFYYKNNLLEIPVLTQPAYNSGTALKDPYAKGYDLCVNEHYNSNWLNTDIESRKEILKGLIDASGDIIENLVYFTNNNSNLIKDVIELVQGLGGLAYQVSQYTVKLKLPCGVYPCKSMKKLENYKPNFRLTRKITNVKNLKEKKKTICIKVAAEDENFITKEYIVTHNTVIAQLSCMQAIDNGYQAILVGPTEILAQQLFSTFEKIVNKMPEDKRPTLVFLAGKMKAAEKRKVLKQIKEGEADIIVGTHTVFSKTVEYHNLGLVVIDEQQKFGTEQREVLLDARADGKKPDILAQTATPIPRSTAQAYYGDIDIISLKGKPKGRIEIQTHWIKENPSEITKDKNHEMWKDIRSEVDKGHQVFVVVPLVYESDKVNSASVEGAHKELQKMFPDVEIGVAHGSQKKKDQEESMEQFRNNKTKILVASTVVEVGVDVPNSTRMVILSAERLGASSLHQIRGRIGRSNLESTCYLVSEASTPASEKRLQALVDSNDGFEIAKVDLETRGEGDLFGLRQSGDSNLRFSNLIDHSKLVETAVKAAKEIYVSKDKELALKDAQAVIGLDNLDKEE